MVVYSILILSKLLICYDKMQEWPRQFYDSKFIGQQTEPCLGYSPELAVDCDGGVEIRTSIVDVNRQ